MNQKQQLNFLKKDSETNIVGESKEGIPIIATWRITYGLVAFFCKHCKRLHKHGWADGHPDGHRTAHCCKEDSPFNKTGYFTCNQGSIMEDFE